jgi:hypothetical protein
MASVNKIVAPRKLRVTVTVEEFDQSNEASNSKEYWATVMNRLKKQLITSSMQILSRLLGG